MMDQWGGRVIPLISLLALSACDYLSVFVGFMPKNSCRLDQNLTFHLGVTHLKCSLSIVYKREKMMQKISGDVEDVCVLYQRTALVSASAVSPIPQTTIMDSFSCATIF